MSTATTITFLDALTGAETSKPTLFSHLARAQEARAAAHIRAFLSHKSDQGLAELGFNAEQIAHIRKLGTMPPL